MARKQNNADLDTRDRLLTVAARMFGGQGYSASSMRAIAQEAGIEAASIYYHFASKESLVDEVMARGYELMVRHIHEHLDAHGAGANAPSRFRAAVHGQLSAVTLYGDYTIASNRLLAQLPERVRERQVRRREEHQKFWSALVDGLRAAQALREDVDPALLRLFIQGCVNSAPAWFNPDKGSLAQVAEQLCNIFLRGVHPGADGTSGAAGRTASAQEPAPATAAVQAPRTRRHTRRDAAAASR